MQRGRANTEGVRNRVFGYSWPLDNTKKMSSCVKTGCDLAAKGDPMMRYLVLAFVVAIGLTMMGDRYAHAEDFYDGCPHDFLYFVGNSDGRILHVGNSRINIGRPGCPWLIVDITGASGKHIAFHGEWAGNFPSNAAECNGAKFSYVVARPVSGTLYTVVGKGTATGVWEQGFFSSHSFCAFETSAGSAFTVVGEQQPNPYNDYRLLLRAWASDGTERRSAGAVEVNYFIP
jgi:hypothetical protein